MNMFSKIIVLLFLALSFKAAAFTNAEKQDLPFINFVTNGGAENGFVGFTSTGTHSVITADKHTGYRSIDLTIDDTTNLETTLFSIPYGVVASFKVFYKTTSANFEINIIDSSSSVVANQSLPACTDWCSSADMLPVIDYTKTYKFQIVKTVASTENIKLDDFIVTTSTAQTFTATAIPYANGIGALTDDVSDLYYNDVSSTLYISNLNVSTTATVPYAPSTPGDWSSVPTTIEGALDIVATKLVTVPTLSITTPLVDQVLKYNGSEWINGNANTSSPSNGVLFYLDDTIIIPSGTQNNYAIHTLNKYPITTTEIVDSTSVTNSTVIMESYLYDTALGGNGVIEAGEWTFSTWAGVDSSVGISEILTNIYRTRINSNTVTITGAGTSRTATASGGTPFSTSEIDASAIIDNASYLQTPTGLFQITARTSDTEVTITTPSTYVNETTVVNNIWKKLFQITTGEINNISPNYSIFETTTSQSSFSINSTDKLSSIYFAKTDSGIAKTLSFTNNGTNRYTHFHSPLITRHNDLTGIQGGATNDNYHLTSTEHGYVSGANAQSVLTTATPTFATQIELGTLDSYSRHQILNYMSDSILTMGAASANGYPSIDVPTEGALFLGQNAQGDPMNSSGGNEDFGYARIKPMRFGLYNSTTAGGADYIFKVDPTSLYIADNSFVHTFEADRATGNVTATGNISAAGELRSTTSGTLALAEITATPAPTPGVARIYAKSGDHVLYIQNGLGVEAPVATGDHNSLAGLQGGAATEYYHQTLNQNANVDVTQRKANNGFNILINGAFENDKVGWDYNGTDGTIVSSAANVYSGKAISWDAANTGDYLITTTADNPVPQGVIDSYGCMAHFQYKGGDTNITAQVIDGSSNVLASWVLPEAASVWTDSTKVGAGPMTFPCASTMQLKFLAGADAAVIYIDEAYLGSNQNLVEISKATVALSAYFATTANCAGWTRTNTVLGDLASDADCPAITIVEQNVCTWSAVDSDLPQITATNCPPGRYVIEAIYTSVTNGNNVAFAITDGTTTSGLGSYAITTGLFAETIVKAPFTYTSTQSSRTFKLQAASSPTGATGILNDTNNRQLSFLVTYYPLNPSQAYQPESNNFFIDANIGGANPSTGTAAVTAYTGITDTGLDLVNNRGVSQIACATTEESSGLTCTGAESVGFSSVFPKAGMVKVCFDYAHYVDADATNYFTWQVVKTGNADQTITQEGGSRIGVMEATASTYVAHPFNLCGIFNITTVGKHTFRLMREQTSGSIAASYIYADRNANYGQRDIHITAWYIDENSNRPYLTGDQVRTPGLNNPSIYSAKITYSGGVPSIANQRYAWLSSVGDTAAGRSTLNINSGTFTAAPSCTITTTRESSGVNACASMYTAPTTSAIVVQISGCVDSVAQDYGYDIICHGN